MEKELRDLRAAKAQQQVEHEQRMAKLHEQYAQETADEQLAASVIAERLDG